MKINSVKSYKGTLLSSDRQRQDPLRRQAHIQRPKRSYPHKFKELDCVEIIADKENCPSKKGMEATVLDIFPGEPDALMLEVIGPAIINSTTSDRVKLLK